jgi:stage II sporulation protein P
VGGAKPPETSRNFGAMLFYLFTNIDIEHPESMLSGQISAMAVSNFKPLIPGFNETPGEDKLPQPQQPQQPEPQPQPEPTVPANGKPLVYIYHTHNRESYLPNLNGETEPNKAYDKTKNITVVGERLANSLKGKGIAPLQTKNDYWYKGDVDNEYDLSRKTVEEVLKKNDSIKMVFDIHRDSGTRDRTTAKWNGQDVAKVFFIIGGSNPKKNLNTEFAKKIHDKLEKMYPGISKGVHENFSSQFDTKYNQDLAPNSVLVEVGGPENSLDEACRTAELLGNVIAEVAKESMKAAAAQ